MTKNLHTYKRYLLTGAAVTVLALGSFYFADKGNAKEGATSAIPAVPVSVQTVAVEDVRLWSSFSGRLRAVDSAEIRPEVSGRITELRFEDGQQVSAGDVLLVIDPRPYEAAVAKAEAALATANTNAEFARKEKNRAEGMMKSQAIAQRLVDERVNALRVAEAAIKSASAELKQAQLDLEHAYVRSPISGRVSRAEITVGNLVQNGPNAPVLTSVVANDHIYADFEVDEQTYLNAIRSHVSGQDQERKVPVRLTVGREGGRAYQGTIHSFDNRIDPASGTIRARAKFDNGDGTLLPGMFVSVALAGGSDSNALLLPERAVGYDQSKKFVYVVDDANKVIYREVQLGSVAKNGQRVVLSGLEPGDRVIVSGIQHVKPDTLVAPNEVSAEEQKQALATR